MPVDNNRLLMELDKFRREINRDVINPVFPELSIEDIKPMINMVAQARASYIKELMDLASVCQETPPSEQQVNQLRHRRETFEELVAAANALETVISREYLDVKASRGG